MKRLRCSCGQQVYFDSTHCLGCDRAIGLDPRDMRFVAPDSPHAPSGGVRHCRNRLEFDVCNWLVPGDAPGEYCLSCAMNDVIPNMEVEGNRRLWARLERAKRRLLYSLLTIGLALDGEHGGPRLRFRFLEDRRRNPHVEEDFVTTGHHDGVITINLAEADDVARTAIREFMYENYRTVLGHFRHETGHYYLHLLAGDPAATPFRDLFGDLHADYSAALERYYRNGPAPAWRDEYISAYASSHPHEDWAETFAHYLHITETLETAAWALPGYDATGDWIERWVGMALALNETSRSLGAEAPYPFVINERSAAKLRYVNRRLNLLTGYSV